MIIRRLQLHPFAGTADREFTLEPGLNVILGPNEAGKTTFSNALKQGLFLSTGLTKGAALKKIGPYLPLGGGDTIRVAVDLESDGQIWKLAKRWGGGGSSSELQLPDGSVISESETVDTRLADLLGLSQGTWEHVLFAGQGGIDSALTRLGEGAGLEDLNEVLRRAVFATDGVSIEALGDDVELRWNNSFGRWDRDLNRPEGNRGLDSPWSRGAGIIVNAWYDCERARRAHREAEAYYRALDEVTARITASTLASAALSTWVGGHADVAADTEKRAVLEGSLVQICGKEEALRGISQAWPVAASKAGELEKQAGGLVQKMEALTAELHEAQAWEAAGLKRGLLEQGENIEEQRVDSRKQLASVPNVEDAQIRAIEALEEEGIRLRARLEAAELVVTFRAQKAIDVEMRIGVEPREARSLADGASLEFTAGARAEIRHADWELEVRAGDIDISAEEARHLEIVEQIGGLLKTIGAEDLGQARELQSNHREHESRFQGLGEQLKELLGEDTLDALRAQVEAGGGSKPKRSAADVAGEHGQAEATSKHVAEQAQEYRDKVEAWKEEYVSPEALLDQLVECRAERTQLESKISALRPLPDGVEDVETFLAEFRGKKLELDGLGSAHNDLLIEKATLEGQAPGLEPTEASEELDIAESALERARRDGEALDRIRRDFDTLRTEMDEGTLEPWLEHLADVVSPLTQERYTTIDLADGAFDRESDDVKVPFDVLSMGTRACLGLAVRLSMARWFLADRGGFLVLDDPFVDLDPERQQAAAVILRNFAKEKQVILFTCHPQHAELLGGATISL